MIYRLYIILVLYVICCTNVIVGQDKPTSESTSGGSSGDGSVSASTVNSHAEGISGGEPQSHSTLDGSASGEQSTTISPTVQPDQEGGSTSTVPQDPTKESESLAIPNPVPLPPGAAGDHVARIPLPKLPSEDSESSTSVTDIEIKSALLKNYDGVKITGPCRSYFRVFLVPHITVYVYATYDRIQLEPKFGPSDLIDISDLTNKCNKDSDKHFKLVLYIKENILTLKWKVQDKDSQPTNINVDVKKYRIPQLERPFTSIQVHTVNTKYGIIESKNYDINSDIPEQCEAISTNCFLSGSLDVENCYHCTLLAKKVDSKNECFNYVSKEGKELINKNVEEKNKTFKGEDEDLDSNEQKLEESIDNILSNIYKIYENKQDKEIKKSNYNNKKELLSVEELNNGLKNELLNYCSLLKEVDTSGMLDHHEIGNEIDIFNNLTRLLRAHPGESTYVLNEKLRNPALCFKNINEWLVNKKGLLLSKEKMKKLSTSEYNMKDLEESEYERSISDDMFEKDMNGVIDLSLIDSEKKLKSPYFRRNKYCNNEYCDRWKDKTGCISKIEVEEQGNCGLCWIFASKLHFETIRCMRGYGHFRSSALYVANCSDRDSDEICYVGSNPVEFLEIVEETGFLPLESDVPYYYTDAGNDCPEPEKNWINLWGSTELLNHKSPRQRTSTRGYISYESSNFSDNMDLFIKIIKREIQNKGSVIAYIKTENVIDYDFNGKGVHNMCGDKEPDHAANIIGYGNYIDEEGEKRSYWLIRNSWGYYWGDEGNFRVDMYGPSYCKYNFIHTVVVFKVDLGIIEVPKKEEESEYFSYFLKYTPNFLYNLFFNNYTTNEEHKLNNQPNMNQHNNKKNKKENYISGQDEPSNGKVESQEQNNKKTEIYHILKHIKDAKIKRGLVKYGSLLETKKQHTCSRTYSIDPERHDECNKFCIDNWKTCKDHYSPGYCLTKIYTKDDNCFFCNV
ncbi:serine repeat antigen 7 [Plasmodium sp. DRC-Itaito]|nr:serine repeat antigen 7 [Plasmodium sp. DRC-Itaito]